MHECIYHWKIIQVEYEKLNSPLVLLFFFFFKFIKETLVFYHNYYNCLDSSRTPLTVMLCFKNRKITLISK